MNPTFSREMQLTHSEFLRELPAALGNRTYEIIGNRVIVHDGQREIFITIRDEPIRHLGSLNLPMEEITFKFVDYTQEEAEAVLKEFDRHFMRSGGG